MKRGKDIYDGPLKNLENKEGTDQLQVLTKQLNDIFYKYCYRYISVKAAQRIQGLVTGVCQKIKGLNVPPKAKAKKEEILSIAREKYSSLSDYIRNYIPESDDLHKAQMVINYQVKEIVAKKKAGIAGEKDLREIKEIVDDYSMKGARLKTIKDLGNEIKQAWTSKYEF